MIKKSSLWCAMLTLGSVSILACHDDKKQKNVTGEESKQKITHSVTPKKFSTVEYSKVYRSNFRIYDTNNGLYLTTKFMAMEYLNTQLGNKKLTIVEEIIY